MIALIFKTICCSAVFIGFYFLFLQREKMFRFNRFYLIASLVLSFSIPFMEFGINEFKTPEQFDFAEREVPFVHQNLSSIVEKSPKQSLKSEIQPKINYEESESHSFSLNFLELVVSIGILISSVFLIRFLVNLWKINRLIRTCEKINKGNYTLVKIPQKISPFSFLHFLFATKSDIEEERIHSEVFYHEIAHIQQKHSFDVLFIEFLLIFFWFNPFLYLYRKAMTINHEFLADQSVLKNHVDTHAYQLLLLDQLSAKRPTVLSSSFNYLVTKKRLIMMTKQTSKLKTLSLKFLSLPLLVISMLLFSQKISAQINPGKGVSKEMFREYKKQVRKATITVKDESGNKTKKIDPTKLDEKLMTSIYEQMSDEQKIKVTPLPTKKSNKIFSNGSDNLVLDLTDLENLKLDDLAKIGIEAGDLGIKIANGVLEGLGEINLNEIEAKVNSPEFQKQIKQIEIDAKKIEDYFNSPEWEKQVKELEKEAEKLGEKYENEQTSTYLKKAEDFRKKAQPFLDKAQVYYQKASPFNEAAKPFFTSAQSYYKKAQEHFNKAEKYSKAGDEKLYEKEMELYEKEMDKYALEMAKYGDQMDTYSVWMDKYGEEMDIYGEWMEKYGEMMEAYSNAIVSN